MVKNFMSHLIYLIILCLVKVFCGPKNNGTRMSFAPIHIYLHYI